MAEAVKTTCPYCGVGCGVIADVATDGTVKISGDPEHPANGGRLCSKGAALAETLGFEDRLLSPMVRGQTVDWPAALDAVAQGLDQTISDHGPESVAFYVSGQMLTEDYYVANKLMKGFIGAANIDTNSRLCMSSSVAGHKRAFGADVVPGVYADWDQADLAVLVGSNAAWCHPVLFRRLLRAQEERGLKLVVIDPRRTASCDTATLHLALKPGTDVMLFNGLLVWLADHNRVDVAFVTAHTDGAAEALKQARADATTVDQVAEYCGLARSDVVEFYRLFTATEKTLTLYSQGVNQSSQGTDKVNAIINCHLLTGRIGRAGMGPFSITGQPNAMGGREVGGLANMLAAHMDFDDESRDRVGRFWQTDRLAQKPGLKAVDLFRAVDAGRVKALWIMATNPAVSMPDANFIRGALAKCPLVIVSDAVGNTDTLKYAHIALPAMTWGEKDGTVSNSERRISRQRAFMASPDQARPDWWIISNVAKNMGFDQAFAYENPGQIFWEHAGLSGFENNGSRAFDLSGISADYDDLKPVQWPVLKTDTSKTNMAPPKRFFKDGHFYTDNKKGQLIAVQAGLPIHQPDVTYPLILNSGRLRDQWHTMTRSGKSPRLNAHRDEAFVAVCPQDAALYGLENHGFAEIESRWGRVLLRISVTDDQPPGQIFIPLHWSDSNAASAVVGRLTNPVTDPHSGQPELKHTPVRLKKWQPRWHGFLLSADPVQPDNVAYWAYSQQQDCHILELAGDRNLKDEPFLKFWQAQTDGLSYMDPASGIQRLARVKDGRLAFCLFLAEKGTLPERRRLQTLFCQDAISPEMEYSVLSGQPFSSADPAADCGPLVCSCMGVGRTTILAAFKAGTATNVAEIGKLLKAGTECGSCRPEIKALQNIAASQS